MCKQFLKNMAKIQTSEQWHDIWNNSYISFDEIKTIWAGQNLCCQETFH